jgi:hypothetical protein
VFAKPEEDDYEPDNGCPYEYVEFPNVENEAMIEEFHDVDRKIK